jgi:hypothetical protein
VGFGELTQKKHDAKCRKARKIQPLSSARSEDLEQVRDVPRAINAKILLYPRRLCIERAQRSGTEN